MIQFEDFSFTYTGQHDPALRRVSLDIGEGEYVLVTGPSGGGKSTLCRCLNGLVPHFHGGALSGRVVVDGLDITAHQPREFAARVGMVFQDPENQIIASDVERDIAFGLENLGMPADIIAQRVQESLDMLGIPLLRRAPIDSLSGGEKQKVALAAALAVRPSVLVLDEPTSELDPQSAREFMETVALLHSEGGLTVVLVEHRIERVADYSTRIVVLDGGSVVVDESRRAALQLLLDEPHGVGVPPMVEVARDLRMAGLWSGTTPTEIDEARERFGDIIASGSTERRYERKPTPGPTLIEVQDLHFQYENGRPALQGVTASVRANELLAVMGRNGSGKTTLARHLNGLLKPAHGRVTVKGADTRHASVSSIAGTVGLVFQNPNDHLFADTVEEEIRFTLKHLQIPEDEAGRRVDDVLALLGLEQYRHHYPRGLSGGERQRIALASVVAARPDVLVLDEPTRGLGHELKEELLRFLIGYCDAGRAVVLITHDVETVARHADRVLLLDEGRVVDDGPRRTVLSRSEVFRPEINAIVQGHLRGKKSEAFMTIDDAIEAFI